MGSRLRLAIWPVDGAGAGKERRKQRFGSLSRDEVLARRDSVKADLDAFLSKSNADLAPLLQEALQPALAAYEELKAARWPRRFSRFAYQGPRSRSR